MSTPPSDNDLCHQQECRQCYPSSDEDDEEHNVLCDCNLQDCRDCFPSSDENDEENKDECQCSRFACRDCFPSSDEDHEDGDMKGEPDKRTLEVHHHYHQPEVHYHYHQPTLSPTPAEYPMALPPLQPSTLQMTSTTRGPGESPNGRKLYFPASLASLAPSLTSLTSLAPSDSQ